MNPPLEAQDFHLAMIRAEPGKGAALHSHLTQEVFVPLSGRWSIFWGPEGDKEVFIEPYDVVSVPIHVMRGFDLQPKRRATQHHLALANAQHVGEV